MLCITRSAWRARASTAPRGVGARQWTIVLHRSYASGTSSSSLDKRGAVNEANNIVRPLLGTVTTNAPARTTIDQLLEGLKDASHARRWSGGRVDNPLLCLLLTPAYARHALDADFPLRTWERIRGANASPVHFDAVTAVVDKLPVGEGSGEGLAYYITSRQESAAHTEHVEHAIPPPQQRQPPEGRANFMPAGPRRIVRIPKRSEDETRES